MKRRIAGLAWTLGFAALLLQIGAVRAHPLAPALLQVTESASAQYAVLWRTSVSRVAGTQVTPRWPQGCDLDAPLALSVRDEAVEARGVLRCEAPGLAGRQVAVSGLDAAGISVILRVEDRAGHVQQTLLDGARSAWTVPEQASAAKFHADYFALGVEHLWLGLDHLLFVAGLMLIVSGWRRLLWTLTAFTLGHSLTLAAASLGWVAVDVRLSEWLIALSLLLLACEAVREDRDGWLRRFPAPLAALFGLVHGLGFAGALSAVGLPEGEIPLALLAFNLGIEAGQIAVVALSLPLLLLARRLPAGFAGTVALRGVPAYIIGSAAAYWCFERGATWMM